MGARKTTYLVPAQRRTSGASGGGLGHRKLTGEAEPVVGPDRALVVDGRRGECTANLRRVGYIEPGEDQSEYSPSSSSLSQRPPQTFVCPHLHRSLLEKLQGYEPQPGGLVGGPSCAYEERQCQGTITSVVYIVCPARNGPAAAEHGMSRSQYTMRSSAEAVCILIEKLMSEIYHSGSHSKLIASQHLGSHTG
jgi:hypothetical protein